MKRFRQRFYSDPVFQSHVLCNGMVKGKLLPFLNEQGETHYRLHFALPPAMTDADMEVYARQFVNAL